MIYNSVIWTVDKPVEPTRNAGACYGGLFTYDCKKDNEPNSRKRTAYFRIDTSDEWYDERCLKWWYTILPTLVPVRLRGAFTLRLWDEKVDFNNFIHQLIPGCWDTEAARRGPSKKPHDYNSFLLGLSGKVEALGDVLAGKRFKPWLTVEIDPHKASWFDTLAFLTWCRVPQEFSHLAHEAWRLRRSRKLGITPHQALYVGLCNGALAGGHLPFNQQFVPDRLGDPATWKGNFLRDCWDAFSKDDSPVADVPRGTGSVNLCFSSHWLRKINGRWPAMIGVGMLQDRLRTEKEDPWADAPRLLKQTNNNIYKVALNPMQLYIINHIKGVQQ